MEHEENLRKFFARDRFVCSLGIEIDEIGEGTAQCSVLVRDAHKNAIDRVQGGVTFTLADFTFAVAAVANGRPAVSLSNTISFLKAPAGSRLTAQARCLSMGKKTCLYEVTVTDDTGVLVAVMTVTGYIKEH